MVANVAIKIEMHGLQKIEYFKKETSADSWILESLEFNCLTFYDHRTFHRSYVFFKKESTLILKKGI